MSKSRSSAVPRLAITPGEPAGIGPDICVSIYKELPDTELIFLCDPGLIEERAKALNQDVDIHLFVDGDYQPQAFNVQPVSVNKKVTPGTLATENASYVLECLAQAVVACKSGEVDGLVTGPVNKAVINDAGIAFTGHTEWLAEQTGTDRVVMMLTGGDMKVALATTHLPLAEVPAAITRDALIEIITILKNDLQKRFGLETPTILVCGLNPHAGEGGHLGSEEMNIISPTVDELNAAGFKLVGPLPADTAFTPTAMTNADAVLAMYHDQGLPVLKHASFGHAVNVTLGLPMIRTSVDHGTALDIAGTGKADPGSLLAAIQCAAELVQASRDSST